MCSISPRLASLLIGSAERGKELYGSRGSRYALVLDDRASVSEGSALLTTRKRRSFWGDRAPWLDLAASRRFGVLALAFSLEKIV